MDGVEFDGGVRHVAIESDIEYIARKDLISGGVELFANYICRGCPNGLGGPYSRATLFIRNVGTIEYGKRAAEHFHDGRRVRAAW